MDALSVNNLSGSYVIAGHVAELVRQCQELSSLTVLTHRGNAALIERMPEGATHVCAEATAAWHSRALWSWAKLGALLNKARIDVVLNPSGTCSIGCNVPQVVLAQNPWPIVAPGLGADSWRLKMQRRSFRAASQRAHRMVFNSSYMKELYERAFGPSPREGVVAYQGVSEPRFKHAGCNTRAFEDRLDQILCVSVMARHKAIEVLIDAFAQVANTRQQTRLVLVGSWPDVSYRSEIESRIRECGIASQVSMLGHVDETRLDELYATSRVFCLLSRCESFGIPAAEAQVFGTPCVVADGTAAPEIVDEGGVAVPMDDAESAATALSRLLGDEQHWSQCSSRARRSAERFHWDQCSRPLIAALEQAAEEGGMSRAVRGAT